MTLTVPVMSTLLLLPLLLLETCLVLSAEMGRGLDTSRGSIFGERPFRESRCRLSDVMDWRMDVDRAA